MDKEKNNKFYNYFINKYKQYDKISGCEYGGNSKNNNDKIHFINQIDKYYISNHGTEYVRKYNK